MGVFHNFKIEPIKDRAQCARLSVDDMPIRCKGYSINHSLDEVPIVTLELCCVLNYEHDAVIRITNKEEIARLMDETEFEEFCKAWKELHEN